MPGEHREDRQGPDDRAAAGRQPLREPVEHAEVTRTPATMLVQRVDRSEHAPRPGARVSGEVGRRGDEGRARVAARLLEPDAVPARAEPARQLHRDLYRGAGGGGCDRTNVQLPARPVRLAPRFRLDRDPRSRHPRRAPGAAAAQPGRAVPGDDDRLDARVVVCAREIGADAQRFLGPGDVDAEQAQDREEGVVGAGVQCPVVRAPTDLDPLRPGEGVQLAPRAVADSAHPVPSTGSTCSRRLRPASGIPTQSGRWSSS